MRIALAKTFFSHKKETVMPRAEFFEGPWEGCILQLPQSSPPATIIEVQLMDAWPPPPVPGPGITLDAGLTTYRYVLRRVERGARSQVKVVHYYLSTKRKPLEPCWEECV